MKTIGINAIDQVIAHRQHISNLTLNSFVIEVGVGNGHKEAVNHHAVQIQARFPVDPARLHKMSDAFYCIN